MTPFESALLFYQPEKLNELLMDYLQKHYVYNSPTAFVMAKALDGTWWIEYAAGDMKEIICAMPFWLPYIRFARNGIVKAYAMAHFVNRILGRDTVKNGLVDSLPRWGWSSGSCETASSAVTYYCRRECGQGQHS